MKSGPVKEVVLKGKEISRPDGGLFKFPVPISNPGLLSIKAVIYSLETPYWFYLSDPETKKTVFSKTLDEHNNNIVKYLSK